MTDKIYLGKKAASFETSPKLAPYDMVIINVDNETCITSPSVSIDAAVWLQLALNNGVYHIAYDGAKWARKDVPAVAFDMAAAGISIAYTAATSVTAGDCVTVEQTSSENDEGETVRTVTASFSRAGSALEVTNPFGSQAIADSMLAQICGVAYQPYTADGARLTPAAELGDAITAYGVYGGLYRQELTFGRLMSANIGAPKKNESSHEYKYESAADRNYRRQLANIHADLIIKASQIEAKVSKTGGTEESFSWELESDHFVIKASGTPMLYIDSSGSQFTGKVRANQIEAGSITIAGQTIQAGYIQGSQIGSATISGGNIGGGTVTTANTTFGDTHAANIASVTTRLSNLMAGAVWASAIKATSGSFSNMAFDGYDCAWGGTGNNYIVKTTV